MSISIDTLKTNLTNPQRVYLWEVIIPSPKGGIADTETLMLRCQSTNIPERSVGNIDVPYKQSAGVRYHGKLAYTHEWAVTFIEGEDHKIFDEFYAWHQLLVDDREGTGNADIDIKTDLYLNLQNTQQEDTMQIKLIGCYPQLVGSIDLSYADEGIITLPVTFAFDRWEQV